MILGQHYLQPRIEHSFPLKAKTATRTRPFPVTPDGKYSETFGRPTRLTTSHGH